MLNEETETSSVEPSQERCEKANITMIPQTTSCTFNNHSLSRSPSAGLFTITRDWMNNENDILINGNIEQRQGRELSLYSSQDFFMHTFVERLNDQGM